MPLQVVTAGETMVLLTPRDVGRLRHAGQLEVRIAGAESNVAIGLARLGVNVGWVSWIGADELGELVLSKIRAEGVDTKEVRRVPGAPTGLYIRERLPAGVAVYYYRAGSAASRMGPGAFDPSYLEGADYFHMTGITPALSPACRELTRWAINEARQRGLRVSFDVNYRTKLWQPKEALAFLVDVLPLVDILFLSDEEAMTLWGTADRSLLEELARQFGCSEIVLKRGSQGSVALVNQQFWEQPAYSVEVRDPIGAGDAFAAGYLAASLWGQDVPQRLRFANAMGAFSVSAVGDYEGLPGYAELVAFMTGQTELGR